MTALAHCLATRDYEGFDICIKDPSANGSQDLFFLAKKDAKTDIDMHYCVKRKMHMK